MTTAVLLALGCAPRPPEAPADPGPPRPEVEFVTHQEVLTPLPLRVRLPASYGAATVLVFFHTWGSPAWGTLELARHGQSWTGEVSCREVSTVTGETRYFFLALDAEGQAVGLSGTLEWPHVATIVGRLPDGPQGLAGEAAPRRCHDPSACPPDFQGCPKCTWRRPLCRSDAQCGSGRRCAWDGYCAPEAPFPLLTALEADEALDLTVARALERYRGPGAPGARD